MSLNQTKKTEEKPLSPGENANFLQVGDGHCFICHEDTKANDEHFVKHLEGPEGISGGMDRTTACKPAKCGKWSENNPKNKNLCGKCGKPKLENKITPNKPEDWCNCGRPTKYGIDLLDKAIEYLDLKMPNRDTEEEIHSIEGLALFINVRRKTIYEWIKDKEKDEFSDIVDRVLEKQARQLIAKGLPGIYSGPITKLMLTKHGYRDTVENINREIPVDPEAKKQADAAIDDFLEK